MKSTSPMVRVLVVLAVVAAMVGLWWWLVPRLGGERPALDPTPSPSVSPSPGEPEFEATNLKGLDSDAWLVTHVYDGDSMVVERDGSTEDVRVIGIDTPERGECGADEARSAAIAVLLDQPVTLIPGAQTDRDRHERLLRYIQVDGGDYGRAMIEQGYAIARYDSRTGQPHDREDDYRDLDAQVTHRCPGFDGAAG